QSRHTLAEPLWQRSLTIRKTILGLEHPEVAVSLDTLAMLYSVQKRFTDADELLREALNIRQKFVGAHRADIAVSYNHLAVLYMDQGAYSDAQRFFGLARGIRNTYGRHRKWSGNAHSGISSSIDPWDMIESELYVVGLSNKRLEHFLISD